MGEAARGVKLGQEQVRQIVGLALGHAAEMLALIACDKCGAVLASQDGPPDCTKCAPVRDFLALPSRSRLVVG